MLPVAGSACVCFALLVVACGSRQGGDGDGSGPGGTDGGSHTASGGRNSGGSRNEPSGGAANQPSGGTGNQPSAGAAGTAGALGSSGPGRSSAAFVSGGELMQSPNYQLFSSMGESLGGTRVLSSKSFELVGGLVRATHP